MSNYLMKYKGKYRLLAELDEEKKDFLRDRNGNILNLYDDIYIACKHDCKIYAYGRIEGQTGYYLLAYIPSLNRGNNIIKILKEKGVNILFQTQGSSETMFKFNAKDIEIVAEVMKAKISGKDISPFSNKNLPKNKDIIIPDEVLKGYKEIIDRYYKDKLLEINHTTQSFLTNILETKEKKKDILFDYKADMKKKCLFRQRKEYIYSMGYWNDYLSYLKEVNKN